MDPPNKTNDVKPTMGMPGLPRHNINLPGYNDQAQDQTSSNSVNVTFKNGSQNPAYDGTDDDLKDGRSKVDTDNNVDCASLDSRSRGSVADLKDFDDEPPPLFGQADDTSPSEAEHAGPSDRASGMKSDVGRKDIRRQEQETIDWDVFIPSAKASTSTDNHKFWKSIFIFTKLVVCILLFLLVLGTSAITKIIFLLVTSNIFPPNSHFNTSYKTADYILTFKGGNLQKEPYTDVQWIWAMMLIMSAPYVFSIGRCLWRLIFQFSESKAKLYCSTVIAVLLIETLHSVGLHVLVFIVTPNLDPISGALISLNVAIFPSYLKIIYPLKPKNQDDTCWVVVTQFVAVVIAIIHTAGLALWAYYIVDGSLTMTFCIILAPILVSTKWWENYVHRPDKQTTSNKTQTRTRTDPTEQERDKQKTFVTLPTLARAVRRNKTKIYLIVNIWKFILTILLPLAIVGVACSDSKKCIDTLFYKHKEAVLDSDIGYTKLVDSTHFKNSKPFGDECNIYLPFVLAAVSILCSGICYKCAKIACKIVAQEACFSLPLFLSTPVAIILFIGAYVGVESTSATGCSLPFPYTRIGTSVFINHLGTYWKIMAAGLTGYLSLLFIVGHVWAPSSQRLKRTDNLFVQPLYCGILLDTSLLLNRRRIEVKKKVTGAKFRKLSRMNLDIENAPLSSETEGISSQDAEETPMLYLCATMWHESENEMTQIMKSIVRLDAHQCAKRNIKENPEFFKKKCTDYYMFETHILFDDAIKPYPADKEEFKMNDYVKQLMQIVGKHAITAPELIRTPYGGQLIWTLPGENKLIAHLKDKAKIRHRKRWSQVMYIYYFLAYRLRKQCQNDAKMLERKAKNTFLLALDGDVDFQPDAVMLLIDRMKKNADVGAACGRIHPIGNGAMVWYQKFEYAVSHWLQKAAEDKLGVVLCSPGCFSLFRASALMDDDVMGKYTTAPTEARHYVQYDQGEDRWLCTLLLQQGHRVEYCAASDALTYAPEGFNEFYNQRRRWSPSTMANILDLLTDWKNVTKKNMDVSLLYVFYQGLLMASSILTPGTIFLLVFGAINMAYPSIKLWHAMLVNLIPVVIFVLLCFMAKKETQLTYAAVLSTIYSLVMMVVLVGLLRNAAEYGLCSVTTIFLLFVAGVFVIAALLHPQEFWCLIHGCLYFLAIPSMSLLLMIYSLANINDVTWGTRETSQPTVKQTAEGKKDKAKGYRRFMPKLDYDDVQNGMKSEVQFSMGNVFRCMCCLQQSDDVGQEKPVSEAEVIQPTADSPGGSTPSNNVEAKSDEAAEQDKTPKEDLEDANWYEGEQMEKEEVNFWKGLIAKYLHPLHEDKEEQNKIKKELKELRNKVCLFFILINALFVTVVFCLQQVTAESGSLSLALPCSDENNPGQRIEPISVAFTLVFGILLFVQFICMLLHRMATLLHIMAATEIFKPALDHIKPTKAETGISAQRAEALSQDMQQPTEDDDTQSVVSGASTATSNESYRRKKDDDKKWRRLTTKQRPQSAVPMSLRENFNLSMLRLGATTTSERGMNRREQANMDSRMDQQFKPNRGLNHLTRKSLRAIGKLQAIGGTESENQWRKGDIVVRSRTEQPSTPVLGMSKPGRDHLYQKGGNRRPADVQVHWAHLEEETQFSDSRTSTRKTQQHSGKNDKKEGSEGRGIPLDVLKEVAEDEHGDDDGPSHLPAPHVTEENEYAVVKF